MAIKQPTWRLRRDQILQPDDWVAILVALAQFSPRDRLIIETLAGAGLRRRELAALVPSDMRPMATPPYLLVRHGKNDKPRDILIAPRLADALLAHAGLRREGPLFASRTRGGHLTGKAVNEIVHAVGRAAGQPDLHAHQLRHFFAITTLRQTGSLEFVRQQLGHASLKITQVYLGIFAVDGARYVEAVDRLLRDPMHAITVSDSRERLDIAE